MAESGKSDRWLDVERDPRFVAFVAHFNGDRDYFECHELMEELWLEEGRHPLLQGLLQAAVGLHHWNNGNVSGAIKLMNQSLRKLGGSPGVVLGLDLADLRSRLEQSLAILTNPSSASRFVGFKLQVMDFELDESATVIISNLSQND